MTEARQETTSRDLLALALVTAIAAIPLLGGRVLGGHDIINYLIIAQQTAANLREGLVFPAWAGGFNAGFGSPLLIFFPPLTGYINALALLAGTPAIAAVCGSALIAHFLSGLAMLWWLRSIGIGRSAVPAAIVYMAAPYRLVDLYLRSALGEHWAFLWPPLILGVASSRRLRAPARVGLLAVLVAALLTTNLPLAVLFGIAMSAWFMCSGRLRGLRLTIVLGAALGFANAAFALVPQALAAALLNLEHCFGTAAAKMRPSANTLFADGFTAWSVNTALSLVMLAGCAIVLIAYLLVPGSARRQREPRLALLAAVVCLGAAVGPAGKAWEALPILSKLQFPWRTTAVVTLLAAALVAQLPPRRAWLVAAIAGVLALPALIWNRTVPSSKFRSERPPAAAPGSVFPDPEAVWESGSGGWYWRHDNLVELCLLPASMRSSMMREFAGGRETAFDSIRGRPAALTEAATASVSVREWGQVSRTVEVDSPTESTMIWRVLDFPAMGVVVDRAEVPSTADPSTGLVRHQLLRGRHVVTWSWRPFPALARARAVTLAGFGATLCLLIASWADRRRADAGAAPAAARFQAE